MKEFVHKVAEMRERQKKYFKYRDPLSLQEAKKAEREVDSELNKLGFSGTDNHESQQTLKF